MLFYALLSSGFPGYPDKAREILEKIEKEHIKLIEIPLRRIALEKRTKQLDTVDKLYEKYLNQWKDEELAKNYFDLAIKYARYSALVSFFFLFFFNIYTYNNNLI